MSKTIEEGFRIFHSWLTPTGGESDKSQSHRASIEACLKSNFGLKRFFRTGSFGNGTSIRGYSDVDYFASIPTESLKSNSKSTLREIKEVLQDRFPNTDVYVDAPAVVVPFGDNIAEWTEVVPANYIKRSHANDRIYEIPDGEGGWRLSSPEAHHRYVAKQHDKLGKKVKPLIRFLKAWKYYRNVPISSFYLEMRTAKYAAGEDYIDYSMDVRGVFKLLHDNGLASLQDPVGVAGYIDPCSIESKKEVALSRVETALKRATNAREAEEDEDIASAFYWWNMVFNDKFPAY